MLILALVCTVIGLALLVAALTTGILPLAWACIGVCVLGFIFLIVDIVKNRNKKKADDEAAALVDAAAEDAPAENNGDDTDAPAPDVVEVNTDK